MNKNVYLEDNEASDNCYALDIDKEGKSANEDHGTKQQSQVQIKLSKWGTPEYRKSLCNKNRDVMLKVNMQLYLNLNIIYGANKTYMLL